MMRDAMKRGHPHFLEMKDVRFPFASVSPAPPASAKPSNKNVAHNVIVDPSREAATAHVENGPFLQQQTCRSRLARCPSPRPHLKPSIALNGYDRKSEHLSNKLNHQSVITEPESRAADTAEIGRAHV